MDLFQIVNIKLETPKRKNQKDYKPQAYIFRKSRTAKHITKTKI